MALQAHPLHAAVKLAEIVTHRQPGSAGPLPVAHRDVQAKILIPAQKGVAHQAGHVVGDRAVDRVLKIQHTQPVTGEHQVARHEVAVHINPAPGQVLRHDGGKGGIQRALLGGIQRQAAVAAQVPLGEQSQFAVQQGLVVERQHIRFGGSLPGHQGVHRLQVQPQIGLRLGRVDGLHHGLGAQVAQQHEALGLVPGQHLGHQQAGFVHQLRHFDKRAAIFFVRRGVHDDAATGHAVNTQVAPETCVGRGDTKRAGVQALGRGQRCQPLAECRFAQWVRP